MVIKELFDALLFGAGQITAAIARRIIRAVWVIRYLLRKIGQWAIHRAVTLMLVLIVIVILFTIFVTFNVR